MATREMVLDALRMAGMWAAQEGLVTGHGRRRSGRTFCGKDASSEERDVELLGHGAGVVLTGRSLWRSVVCYIKLQTMQMRKPENPVPANLNAGPR